MILWEKYYNHVHFIKEHFKTLGCYVTCPRFLFNQVVEWEFSQVPDLLLCTLLGANKSSITIYAFPVVWRYQLVLFHQKWQILCGQSCLLLPQGHQYEVTQSCSSRTVCGWRNWRLYDPSGITFHICLEENDFHISLVTLGQAGCEQKPHKPEALTIWGVLGLWYPSSLHQLKTSVSQKKPFRDIFGYVHFSEWIRNQDEDFIGK